MKDNYGRSNAKAVKKLYKIAKLVLANEQVCQSMTDEQLREQTQAFKNQLANGATLDDVLPMAFAVCREAGVRVLHQRAFDTQIMGGIAIHQGRICQMATGEGKTLTETFPAYLNALSGNGVHIVTVNEYLACRDKDWMGKIFRFLGLTVDVITTNKTQSQKKQAYNCDITYGTNSEFGFDYLRDNMAQSRNQCVQRGHNFVIIDEVDSILIDEARTPLILSGPSGKSDETYVTANKFACTLVGSTNVDEEGNTPDKEQEPNGDYVVDKKSNSVRLTDRGYAKAERYFKVDNLSSPENGEINHFINCALQAHALFRRDEHYIVERGQVVIVDSFTGRKMEGRRFSKGIHQAIEAKEHVTVKKEDQTLATITLQNYFRMYRKLSGMTGTAKTEEKEFNSIYNIDVVAIPTNLPLRRQDNHDMIFPTRQGKLHAVVKEIQRRHESGQPMLVGTVTVDKSEELSAMLSKCGVPHVVLNAKNHKREAEIVAQAGRLGAVTIATNMAGRGTDILLGGNAEFMAKQEMKRQGYTDEQIEKSTSFVVGDAEVDQLRPIFESLVAKYQQQTNAEKQQVVQVGGLCVIGTERHESRRIDDQLRGRSGRQGDPGESVFFVSAEDEMIKVFGGNMLQNAMAFFKWQEDEPMQSRLLTKAVESAQKRLEGLHFSGRKHVLQYDDINNAQRKAVYKERNRILDEADVHKDVLEMASEYARLVLGEACNNQTDVSAWNLGKVNEHLSRFVPSNGDVLSADDLTSAKDVWDKLTVVCKQALQDNYDLDKATFEGYERWVLLKAIDKEWINHVDMLDELRQGVGLQAIGQHDPLAVYKKESYEMYQKYNEEVIKRTVFTLLFSKLSVTPSTAIENQVDANPDKALNRPCPCGSGKKYKNCCYQKDLAKENQSGNNVQLQKQEGDQLSKQQQYALKRQQRKEDKSKK